MVEESVEDSTVDRRALAGQGVAVVRGLRRLVVPLLTGIALAIVIVTSPGNEIGMATMKEWTLIDLLATMENSGLKVKLLPRRKRVNGKKSLLKL